MTERIFNQYNMIDTTSFMLGNLQSIFYLQKEKYFISNKKTSLKTSTHQSQSLLSSFTLFNNCSFLCRRFDINYDLLSRFAIENLIVGTTPLSTNFQ